MGQLHRPLPATAGNRGRHPSGRRRRRDQSAGVLQRRVQDEQPGADARGDRWSRRRDRPAVVARRSARNHAGDGRHLQVLRRRRLRQARGGNNRRLADPDERTDRPDPREPLPAGAGRRLLARVRPERRAQPVLVLAGASRAAPALPTLRPIWVGSERRLGNDPAVALAVDQLQPVHGDEQSVAVRQPAGAVARADAGGARARPVLRGPRRGRRVRGVGRGRAPVRSQPGLRRHRRLLDGGDRNL